MADFPPNTTYDPCMKATSVDGQRADEDYGETEGRRGEFRDTALDTEGGKGGSKKMAAFLLPEPAGCCCLRSDLATCR